MLKRATTIVTLAILAHGCSTYEQTLVRGGLPSERPPSPVVQRLLGNASGLATVRQFAKLSRDLEGKRVCVSAAGVLVTDAQLLSYLRARVESEIAEAGAIVVSCCDRPIPSALGPRVDSSGEGQASVGEAGGAPALVHCDEPLDYRAVVTVHAGGVDVARKKEIAPGRLAGQLSLMLVPAVVTPVTTGVAVSEGDTTLLIVPIPLATAAIIAGIIWMSVSPPYDYSTRLDAAVVLDVSLVPQHAGLPFARVPGAGAATLDIPTDEDAPHLYVAD